MEFKLLIVDDERETTAFLAEFLLSQGYKILLAGSGDEALAILEREPMDLVVLDLHMSQLIGSPVRTIITASPNQPVEDQIGKSLIAGGISLGIQFATEDLDPLLGALAAQAVTGAIDGLVSPPYKRDLKTGEILKDPTTGKPLLEDKNGDGIFDSRDRKGIFQGLADTLTIAAGGFTDIGLIKPGDPVGNAQRLAQLNDFSNIIREQGLGTALDTYATSIFYRSSIESLLNAGSSVGQYGTIKQSIEAQMVDPLIVELEGKNTIQISLGKDPSGNLQYIWLDPDTYVPMAGLQGQDYTRYGTILVDPNTRTLGAPDAEITRTFTNPLTGEEVAAKIRLEAAGADWIEIQGPNGDTTHRITPDNLNRLRLNSDGTVKDGILTDLSAGQVFRFRNGVVQSASDRIRISDNPQLREALQPYGLTPDDIDALVVDISQEGERLTGDVRLELSRTASPTLTSAQLTEVTLTVNEIYQEQTRTFFGNGISNPEELGTAPEYARRYGELLTTRGLTAKTIPLFEGGKFVGDIIRVGSEIVLPFSVDRERVKGVILDQLAQEPLQSGEKLRLILYSGAGQAGIEAAAELGRERGIQFSDIILVDSPVFFESALPNVERITMLVGNRDPFTKIGLEATLSLGHLLFLGDPSGFNDLLAAPFKVTANDLSLGMALPIAPVLTPFGFRLKLANPAVNSKITVHRFEGWGHLDFIDVEDSAKIERVVDTIEQALRR